MTEFASAIAGIAPARTRQHLLYAWHEARPVVQAIFQLRFFAGAAVSAPEIAELGTATTATGALGWLCATWHIYLLNGLCDRVEDRVNGSGRPLATGRLDAAVARRLCGALAALSLLLGLVVSLRFAVLVCAILALGWSYSAGRNPQKNSMAGFVLVVTGGGVVTYLAGCEAAGGEPSCALVVLMAMMSLWMGLAGMTKDLSDVAGDRAAGRRTLPVILGDVRARRLMAVAALAVGAMMITAARAFAPVLTVPALLLLTGSVAVALCATRSAGSVDRQRQRLPYRLFMVSQYAVHAAVLGQVVGLAQ